ncbi:MAG TPA: protein kinase, partial [Thermoanaerobaculia bacterium]|nr:protein kinase [Thermoanaerobaculia bacterium]
ILDFGLAKPVVKDRSGEETRSPTVSAYTEPGTILGTVGYMSPEQVKGQPVDVRSDIFSFGAVLYEMLTGKRSFQRETAAETMTAILREEPPELSESGRHIPPALDRIVRHCLEKKPEKRFQSASDIAFALEDLTGGASGARPAAARSSRSTKLPLVAAACAVVGLLVGGAVTGWLRKPREAEPIRVHALTFSSRDSEPAASPDGRLIAFTSWRDGTSRIWVKQIAGGGEAPLTSGPDRRARFSPDGSNILFLRDLGSTQAVYRVGLVGGEARKIVDNAVEADWAPDGRRIAFVRLHEGAGTATLFLFDTESGKETVLFTGREEGLFSPRWSPDGRSIAFAQGDRNRNNASWELLRIDPSNRRVTTIRQMGPGNPLGGIAWSGSGRQFFFIQSASVMGDVSGAGSRFLLCDARTGKETALLWAEGLATINGTEGGVSFCDILTSGRLVFSQRLRRQNLREVALGPSGAGGSSKLLTEGSSIDRQPTYSPDGKRVLFSSNRSGNLDLWILERPSGSLRQVTDDAAQDWDPAFTPDGKQILWSCNRRGHLEVWAANSDGSGAHQLTNDGLDAENPTATPDGKWVVYWSGNPQKAGVWRIHPDGSGASQLVHGNSVGTTSRPTAAMSCTPNRIRPICVR